MKKYILLFITIALLGACDLDMQPDSDLTYNGFWDTEEAARAAHTGIYASYRNYAYTIWQMGELRSDIWGGNTIESPNFVPYGTKLDLKYLCSLTSCFIMFVSGLSRWRCLEGGRSPTGKHLQRGPP